MIRVDGNAPPPRVGMEEVALTPAEQAGVQVRREKYLKNLRWFESHVAEIREHHSGKSICVAGETLFARRPKEVVERARAAFPGDWGSFFTMYISPR